MSSLLSKPAMREWLVDTAQMTVTFWIIDAFMWYLTGQSVILTFLYNITH